MRPPQHRVPNPNQKRNRKQQWAFHVWNPWCVLASLRRWKAKYQPKFRTRTNTLEWHGLHVRGHLSKNLPYKERSRKKFPKISSWSTALKESILRTSYGVFSEWPKLTLNQWFKHGWKTGLEFVEYMKIIFRLFEAVTRVVKLPRKIMTVGDVYDRISERLNNIHFQLKVSKANTISGLEEFEDLYLFHSMKIKVQRSPLAFKSCAKKNIRLRVESDDVHNSKSKAFRDWGAMLTVGNGSLADFKRKTAEDIHIFSEERRILQGAENLENLTVKDEKKKKIARKWKKMVRVMRFLRFERRKNGIYYVTK